VIPGHYSPPPFTGKFPSAEIEGSKLYTGGCHCGAVTLAVKTKPLPTVQIKEDNCSNCVRVCFSLSKEFLFFLPLHSHSLNKLPLKTECKHAYLPSQVSGSDYRRVQHYGVYLWQEVRCHTPLLQDVWRAYSHQHVAAAKRGARCMAGCDARGHHSSSRVHSCQGAGAQRC
jgi:hypothetical protein